MSYRLIRLVYQAASGERAGNCTYYKLVSLTRALPGLDMYGCTEFIYERYIRPYVRLPNGFACTLDLWQGPNRARKSLMETKWKESEHFNLGKMESRLYQKLLQNIEKYGVT